MRIAEHLHTRFGGIFSLFEENNLRQFVNRFGFGSFGQGIIFDYIIIMKYSSIVVIRFCYQ